MGATCLRCKHKDKTVAESPCNRCYNGVNFEDGNARESQPTKTLLDEFAMAAMAGSDLAIWKINGAGGLADNCYNVAAAMMKERARRDEIGNVKEVK